MTAITQQGVRMHQLRDDVAWHLKQSRAAEAQMKMHDEAAWRAQQELDALEEAEEHGYLRPQPRGLTK